MMGSKMTETERVARSQQVFEHTVRMQLHNLSDLRLTFNALDIPGHEQMKAFELIKRETQTIIEDIRRQIDKSRHG